MDFQEKIKGEVMRTFQLKNFIIFLLFINSTAISIESAEQTADLIVFSYDRPLQLHALLASLETYAYNLGSIYLVCRMSDSVYERAYKEVLAQFPQVTLLQQGKEPKKDFKKLTLKAFNDSAAPYIMFTTDDLIVKDYIDIKQCINALNATNSYGFYLRMGTNITYSYNQNIALSVPKLNVVEPGIFSWNFSDGKSYWGYPNSLDMALFKKTTIEQDLNNLSYHSPNVLESRWARIADKSKTGLCFKSSKAFNIPLNLVQEDWYNKNEALFTTPELLDMWNQGLMMNIIPFHQINNNSAMMAYTPKFIQRPLLGLPEKKITVIIPSYNNALYYLENIESVLKQNYTNYHIVYIDDASPDGTGSLVENYIASNGLQEKITLIKNDYNRKALSNVYRAAHMCDPQDIILELDGDDSLAHPNIFKEINSLFSTYNIWLAYAQYKNVPEEKARESKMSTIGYAKPTPSQLIESRQLRGKWMWSGLRMFYAWLIQEVKLEDLLLPDAPYKGKFFPTSKDAAIIYPMLEMAGDKFMFIPSLWLMRNVDTPLNDFKIGRELQKHCGDFLRTITAYNLLDIPINTQSSLIDVHCPYPCTDVIIQSSSIDNLQNYLMSLNIFTIDSKNVYVLYDRSKTVDYHTLRTLYPTIKFIGHDATNQSIARAFEQAVSQATQYILITNDTQYIKKPISFTVCVKELERTKAKAWYFGLNLKAFGDKAALSNLPCEQINEDMYAWKCSCFNPSSHNLKAGLYRRQDVLTSMQELSEFSLEQLTTQLYITHAHSKSVGLFFEQLMINEEVIK